MSTEKTLIFLAAAIIPTTLMMVSFIRRSKRLGYVAAFFWTVFGGVSWYVSENGYNIFYVTMLLSLALAFFTVTASSILSKKIIEK